MCKWIHNYYSPLSSSTVFNYGLKNLCKIDSQIRYHRKLYNLHAVTNPY